MPKLPIDYSKGFIYKLCCLDVNIKDIYIGSSTNFKQRKTQHKSNCNNEKGKTYNSYIYKFIRDNGGWDNWTMIELYKYPCNDKRELECEENRMMNELQSQLNSKKPYITEEEIREYNKNYREEHKEELKILKHNHYENNKEEIKIKNKEKIVCDNCGALSNRTNLSRHKKSKKCLNFNN
tara:strand:- start:171 stop:710 length:540 start_codon:yes stop_codon:yes gene_type:complete